MSVRNSSESSTPAVITPNSGKPFEILSGLLYFFTDLCYWPGPEKPLSRSFREGERDTEGGGGEGSE